MTMLERQPPEKKEAIELLLRCGVTENVIAKELDIPIVVVREVAQFRATTTFSTRLNPKDAELAEAMRNLAWKAYQEALVTMEFGNPTERASLVRAVINRSMSLVGAEKSNTMDRIRDEFNEMVGAIRAPDDYEYELPEDDEDAVEAGSTTIDSYDS